MKYDEVKNAIKNIVSKPDEAATLAAPLLEALQGDYATMESVSGKVTEQEERIKTLQDTNMKLFLQITGEPSKEDEPELTGKEKANAFWDKFNEEV